MSQYGSSRNECKHCWAVFWDHEKPNKEFKRIYPKYKFCCKQGKIQLPKYKKAPEPLHTLLYPEGCEQSSAFLENIRAYNSMFPVTSMGAKVDKKITNKSVPYICRINGENYHWIGSLLPANSEQAHFIQLYFHNTSNEVQNRIKAVNQRQVNGNLNPKIVESLIQMFDEHNELVKIFTVARDKYASG